ncbi:MAG: hypothetical protein ACI97A_001411 [Planctomycetota bacterium]|jgi:hypothetical protein
MLGQDHVDEYRGRARFRGKLFTLGEHRDKVIPRVGPPTRSQKGEAFYKDGLTLQFGSKGILRVIEVQAPFTGSTQNRLKIGSPARDVVFNTRRKRALRKGWNQTERFYLFMNNNRVTKIRVGTPPKNFVPTKPIPTKKPAAKRPARKPVNQPQETKPNNRTRPKNNLRPNTNPQSDRVLVWQSEWQAQRRLEWKNVPTNTWSHSQGYLLVRVALGPNISKCEQFYCGHELAATRSGDYIFNADTVAKRRRPGRALSWQWRLHGQGNGKVRVIWFRRLKDLKRYQISQPFASNFNYAPVVKPWRKQVKLVWEETWTARSDGRLRDGPKENWPDDDGVLLIRSFGEPGITDFIYQAGLRTPVGLQLGDHELPVNILDKAKKASLFGGLSRNNAHKRFHFGFRGRGQGKVMIYWLPESRYVKTYCQENNWDRLNPWHRVAPKRNLLNWVFQGPQKWRSSSQFESDWRTPLSNVETSLTNVASRANGSLVRRSSRDPRQSRGSEFDNGIWQSRPGRDAFSESRFTGHVHLNRIEIGSAGSDFKAARYILVELERDSGTWDRVAAFHNENINWHRLGSDRRGISRPSISIPLDPRVSYRGMRILFSGHGPFRLAGVRAIGRFHGDRVYDDLPDLVETARTVEVSSTLGWTDTGGDVIAGRAVLVDIEGQWSLDSSDDGRLGWSGPEGVAAALLRGLFSSANSHNDYKRRLPAPNLPAGALIGRIGLNGQPFQVTPGRELVFNQSGHLYLGINDNAFNDNRGTLFCTVLGASFHGREAEATPPVRNVVEVVCTGRVISKSLNRGISDVDVFAQLQPSPRTIYGGTRSDNQGRFEFVVLVPIGQPIVIGAPEFKAESQPRVFRANSRFSFDIELQ